MAAIYEPAGMAREYAPLACNLYKGCTHGCSYCYAPACLRMTGEQFWASSALRKGILDDLRREAPKYRGDDRAILLCFTSDPYQPEEAGHASTREAVQTLADAGCRFQVLTKGGTRAARDFDILSSAGAAFGTTLCFTDDACRQEWEPGAAPVDDRLTAIAMAHDLGIRTWVSIEPVIDPAQALDLIRGCSDIVDEWRVGKLNHHPHARTVNWSEFAADAIGLLEASGRDYMVKDALQPFLPKGAPTRRYGEAVAV